MQLHECSGSDNSRLGSAILDPLGFLLIPEYSPELPKKLLRRMLCTGIWHKYQRGRLRLPEAAAQLAKLPFLASRWAPDEIASLLRPRAVHAMPWMLEFLDVLRDQLHLKLVCICNSSAEEFQQLRSQFPALFAKFDVTVTSCQEGVGKPSVQFLRIALENAGLHAQETLYLDSFESLESIMCARSLGMHALSVESGHINELNRPSSGGHLRDTQLIRQIVCAISSQTHALASSTPTSCALVTSKIQELHPAVANIRDVRSTAIASAQQFFLQTIAAHDPEKPFIQLPSLTSEGIRIFDNFAQFLIADLLHDTRFLPMQSAPPNGLITFVNTSAYLAADTNGSHDHVADNSARQSYASDASTFMDIPHDLDTTSIGLSVLHKFGKVDKDMLNSVLDRMLEYVSHDDGILQVYFDVERPRIDPVAVANTVYLFHLGKRGHEVEKSEKFLESVLRQRAYEEGTLYYNLGEAFVLSVARLVHGFKEHFNARSRVRRALEERLRERASAGVQESDDALALAMRIRACSLCGLEEALTRATEQELVRRQSCNGTWDCHPFYRYGSNVLSWIGNNALTTAYALAALQRAS